MSTGPILIVDDEALVRGTLAEALEFGGYDVDCAGSAAEALDKLAGRVFPVVLTDMNMPGGPSGLDLLSEIRSRDPNVMVIIITGFATLDTAVSALKRGAYDFIQKPFKISEIEATLDRALEHARLLRQLDEYHHELEDRVLARTRELREFHEEVLRLNDLTLKVAGETDAATLVDPFLDHLEARLGVAAAAVLQPAREGWILLRARGGSWDLASLPPPRGLPDLVELAGTPWNEAYLLRLGGATAAGALVLGFRQRSSFYPEEPFFALWRKQLGALLQAREKTLARPGR